MEISTYYTILFLLICSVFFGMYCFYKYKKSNASTPIKRDVLFVCSTIFGFIGASTLLFYIFLASYKIEEKIIYYPEEVFIYDYKINISLVHDDFKYTTYSKDKYHSIKNEFFIIELIQYSNIYGTIVNKEPILIQKEEKQIKPIKIKI